jgi:hypothetical protein
MGIIRGGTEAAVDKLIFVDFIKIHECINTL